MMSFWKAVMRALESLAVKRGGACQYSNHTRFDPASRPKHRPYR